MAVMVFISTETSTYFQFIHNVSFRRINLLTPFAWLAVITVLLLLVACLLHGSLLEEFGKVVVKQHEQDPHQNLSSHTDQWTAPVCVNSYCQ